MIIIVEIIHKRTGEYRYLTVDFNNLRITLENADTTYSEVSDNYNEFLNDLRSYWLDHTLA